MKQHEKLFDENFNPMDKSQLISKYSPSVITKIPEKIVFKLAKFSKEKTYYVMDYFKHRVGISEKDTRDHVCQISIGGTFSPEKDAYFNARKELKILKEKNGNKDRIAQLEVIINKFKPTTRAYLLIIMPNDPKPKALRVPMSVVDDIFGVTESQAKEYRPARKGLLSEMLEEGRSPFDVRSNVGWIQLTKTGTGIATRYKVEELQNRVTKVEGKQKITYSEPGVAEINPAILNLTTADIPDVFEFERKFAFTLEEAKEFVESLGAKVPARFLKSDNQKQSHDIEKSDYNIDNSISISSNSVSIDESEFLSDDEALPF